LAGSCKDCCKDEEDGRDDEKESAAEHAASASRRREESDVVQVRRCLEGKGTNQMDVEQKGAAAPLAVFDSEHFESSTADHDRKAADLRTSVSFQADPAQAVKRQADRRL
jgi:hypothetical protein